MRVALILLPRSMGFMCAVDSGRMEKEKTSPMEDTAQIVEPPDATFVMMFGTYVCLGRKTDEKDILAKSSPNRSNGKLVIRESRLGVILDAKISTISKYQYCLILKETDRGIVDSSGHFNWRW